MSYCNLCRKQFTSPDQLKEHLDGAAHKQKLADVKAKQSKSKILGEVPANANLVLALF